ncbi:ricin-type beta-trefoil lectin domain protein [Streptomyces sp. NPDC101225]|uniref:ricin-type beta-trefoil lectin domain protein n=1 Tax=Streptomyces sp. NPDC101225 TaxID=3366135 RepID=UPI00382EC596
MKHTGLSNSPRSDRRFDVTDEQLGAELKKWTGSTPALQPVGELLDRHWEAGFAYARLCTDAAPSAGMLTTAAFTRLFGETLRQNGPTSAWRPQLLVTVRRIAAEWDNDHRREHLNPGLCAGGERAAALLLPSAGRRLLSGAFQRVPQSARCLLWHIEVEAEAPDVPAGLLGLEVEDARVELERARERLREECLQVHRELAPEQECRRFLRMLDVTYRRGGTDIDPDLGAHLSRCRHCLHTADQLAQFNHGLGLALAEAVLGWGARAYVESRTALPEDPGPLPPEVPLPPIPGEPFAPVSGPAPRPEGRVASRRSAHRAARRRAAARRRNLALAVVTVSGLIVLPLILWSVLGSDGTTTAGGHPTPTSGQGKGSPTADPSWVGTSTGAQGTLRGRLRNLGSGLCVAVVGRKPVEGAEAQLTGCSSAGVQQWSYATDGRLRSVADPGLCLDSHLGFSVRLVPCTGTSDPKGRNVRYDFTLQGTLVPRWNQDLALAPAATDGSGALVAKNRDGGDVQRWVFATSKADLQMQAVNWDADDSHAPTASAGATPKASRTPSATPTPSAAPTTAQPTPTSAFPTGPSCYDDPYACVRDGGRYGGRGGGGRH